MKRIILLSALFMCIGFTVFPQNYSRIHITFFGSSVCRGAGAEDDHGYGRQFFNSGAIDTLQYKYFNASTGGDNTIHYKELSAIYPKHLNNWTHVVLSHSYANQKSMLFVDGEPVGSVYEQLSPIQVHFGGTATITELKDLTLHRSSLNENEALDLFNKKFIQSSLEFYNPLTHASSGNTMNNNAQSLSVLEVNKHVVVEHHPVDF